MIVKTILGYIFIVISFIMILGIVATIPKAFLETASSFSDSSAYGFGYLFGTLFGYFIVAILSFYIYRLGVKLKTKKVN
ncbi:MAG: hypothetical protein V4666_00985 [Bacteroidota bacterium]